MIRRLLPILLLLAGCARQAPEPEFPAPESPPSIQATVSTETPKLGEVIDAHVRVTAEDRHVLPPLEDWLHPSLRLLEQSSEVADTEAEWRKDFKLKLGLYAVTNITLFAEASVDTLADPPETLDLPSVNLSTASTLEEENPVPKFGNDELPDFRGSEAIKRFRRNLIISLVALLVLIAFLVAVFRHLRNRPKPPPPPIPSDEIALREMMELRESEAWKQPDIDECAVRLSRILRRYIERRFGIDAPDRTTEEFLHEVEERRPWPESEHSGLTRFFEVTDRIKYAAERPDREALDDLMSAAESFVISTRRRPTEERS